MDLVEVAAVLRKFSGADLTATLARIEASVKGVSADTCSAVLASAGADGQALGAAAALKRVAGQINVAIHAIGILLCLPHLLEAGEMVEYASLGAGNTGRSSISKPTDASRNSNSFTGGAGLNRSDKTSFSKTSIFCQRALRPNANISTCSELSIP